MVLLNGIQMCQSVCCITLEARKSGLCKPVAPIGEKDRDRTNGY